jgi:hypothetical protein
MDTEKLVNVGVISDWLRRLHNVQGGIGKFVCESQPEIKDGRDAVERTDTRGESKSEAAD